MKMIDFRRDTVTQPSAEMLQNAFTAKLGDSVYNEDPQQLRLEQLSAQITGKDAALFLPSGTMGNLAAILAHTRRGDEIILEENAHIFTSETGGAATLGGVSIQRLYGPDGLPDPMDIENAIRQNDIHYPRTGLICLEVSHYRYGGIVPPLNKLQKIRQLSLKKNIPIHLDGARLFNAAVYLKTDVKKITEQVDSVMFCLSKGLGAPVGSMLCGSISFIEEARRYRKLLGGGMRQTGWLCSCGITAISRQNISHLERDHENALLLAERLNECNGISVNLSAVHTNFVIVNSTLPEEKLSSFAEYLMSRGILINRPKNGILVFVISRELSKEDINSSSSLIMEFLGPKQT